MTPPAAERPIRAAGPPSPAATGPLAWTLDEAREQLALHPRDAYLQYVLLQLGRRAGTDLGPEVRQITGADRRLFGRADQNEVDLFGMFTGALAVQESLQLDTMTGGDRDRRREQQAPRPRGHAAAVAPVGGVDVDTLAGPGVKSHPWEQMLAGRKPEVSALSRCVPADFYLVECRSLTRLLDVADATELWSTQLFSQGLGQARDAGVADRLRRQLAIKVQPLMRPFYDTVVDGAAITGSDLFAREGSDVTLLFHLKQPALFRARMASFMDDAERETPAAKRGGGEILGVKYVELFSPDGDVCVFAADPAPDLHVRSNSKAALERVLAAMRDGGSGSLGLTKEFAYVRTLMPLGAAEEDVLVYLSDPFIRRLVGPRLKLTERRRVLCHNHLRMIAHASVMYQTETGRAPASVDALIAAKCLPDDRLACPHGGAYGLSADGLRGVCSVHGHADQMTPCLDVPLSRVTADEAERYAAFVQSYNAYWRQYFDPIAIRLRATPQQFRAETIILPLIDNTVYTSLARTLGGKPEALDALPVPARTIFSVGARLDKDELLRQIPGPGSGQARPFGDALGKRGDNLDVRGFVGRGLGNQVGLHVYDAPQTFGLDVPGFLSGTLSLRGGGFGSDLLTFVPLVVSLNSPVYMSFPVQDPKVVDDFLAATDQALGAQARVIDSFGGFLQFERDYYREGDGDPKAAGGGGGAAAGGQRRAHVLRIGPITWRFFWERIGDGLYVASKSFILDDLRAAHAARAAGNAPAPAAAAAAPPKAAETGAVGHATVRVRPAGFDAVLPEFERSWAESNRRACLDNLGPLSDAARAATAAKAPAADPAARAAAAFGHRFHCPDGGRYEVSADGKHVTCTAHGSVLNPLQPAATPREHGKGQLYGTAGVSATLTFLEDGLHAVVTIDRK